jgi:predicted transposase YdaD
MTQTYAQDLLEQGRQQGRQEGRQGGELKTLRGTLVRLARLRFGELSPEWEQRIASLHDAERLRHALDLVVQVQRLEDLGL